MKSLDTLLTKNQNIKFSLERALNYITWGLIWDAKKGKEREPQVETNSLGGTIESEFL